MWTFPLICTPQQSRCWWGMMTSVWVALFVQPWLADACWVGGFGRSKCATVWAVELQTFNSCEIFHVKFWKADWTVDHIIFFFTEFARGKGQIWSIMGARGLRDGGLHHYFQKLKSTPLYSLYCLTACTIWWRSLVWWIMETKPDQTLCLDFFFCRRSTCINWFSVQVRLFLHLPHSI